MGSSSSGRRVLPLLLALAVVVAGGWFGIPYFLESRHFEWTDNAFLEGDVVLVSSQVAGRALRVHVDSNDEVSRGDILVEVDPEYYEAQLALQHTSIALAESRRETAQRSVELLRVTTAARVQQAEADLVETRAGVEEARSAVASAEARALLAEQDFERHENADVTVFTLRENQSASSAAQVARAELVRAGKQVAATEAEVNVALGRLSDANSAPEQLRVRESEVEQITAEIGVARAALRQTELDLEHTKVQAPTSGRVARKSIHEGEHLRVGQIVMTIVPPEIWVIANFRETQLEDMKPGQPVEIRVDTYPGKVFMGHVDSMQAGTGARFSLLPPQNATGNYVKVVQRVPVKIVFDEVPDRELLLAPGMSVVPKVRVR